MRFISEDTYKGKIEESLSLNYYGYCEGNPIKYIHSTGNFGEDVHHDYTLEWAKDFILTEKEAELIAAADVGVDSGFTNPVMMFFSKEAQSWHFDVNDGKGKDSRIEHYEECFSKAKLLLSQGKKEEALRIYGRGLHAL